MRFALVRRGRTCPEVQGEWVFQVAGLKFRWKGQKPGTWKNGKIYLCWRAPPHCCFLVARLDSRQKRVFENRQIFAETTENVVPNCRGSKTHFGALGSGTSHVKSGSNMVPKYFSLNWHFLSHSPSRRQGELFYFSCFRKILVSVKFVSAILGPEMAAPILWTPRKMRPFCRKSHVHKIPRFRGGVFWFFFGGGECRFYFYGREDFSDCFFPFLAQVPFYIFHGRICSATTCAICPFCCVSFLLFLLVVFVFLLVSLLLILLRHSFLSLSLSLS